MITNNRKQKQFSLRIVAIFTLFILSSGSVWAAGKAMASSFPPAPETKLSDVLFVAFDTETTGFGAANNSIIEIGAVKFRGNVILEEKSWLIHTDRKISWWAQKAHGITPEMLKDKPPFREVYPEFVEFCKGAVILAHNATFDIDFIKAEVDRVKAKPLANPCLDSLPMFRTLFPDAKSHSLEPLSTQLGVNGEVYHRATDDSRYIFLILDKALEKEPANYTYGQLVEAAHGAMSFK